MHKVLNLVLIVVVALMIIMGSAIRVTADNSESDYYLQSQDGGQVEETPIVVVENTTDWNVVWSFASLLIGLLVGGGGVLVVLGRANASKPVKDSTEQLLAQSVSTENLKLVHSLAEGAQQISAFLVGNFKYPGIPGPVANAIREGAHVAQQAADFIEAVTDGQENEARLAKQRAVDNALRNYPGKQADTYGTPATPVERMREYEESPKAAAGIYQLPPSETPPTPPQAG